MIKGKQNIYFIEDKVKKEIHKIAKQPLESGGYLLGRRILGTNEFVIDTFTTPIKSDIRKKESFISSYKTWLEANKIGDKKNRMVLGDWHTHPPHLKCGSQPSSLDFECYKQQMKWRTFLVCYIAHVDSETTIIYERPKEEIVHYNFQEKIK